MAHVYVTRSDVKLGIDQGRLTIKQVEESFERSVPLAGVDSVNVFGSPQLSTQLIRECLSSGIPVGYYSEDGHYFGKISSFDNIDPSRHKKQIILTDNEEFCLVWAKRIVAAKIRNSLALLESMRDVYSFSEEELHGLKHSLGALKYAESVDMVLGLEGNAAKVYFRCLPKLVVNDDFSFEGRSARPPKDPFNSMLSYGYSLFHRNIVGAIERHGLHPYFGYMHKIRRGHAALASDLIEECRAPLVDRAVIALANSGEISSEDFMAGENGSVYMSKKTMKHLTDCFSDLMSERRRYFAVYGDGRSYAFQAMLDRKLCSVVDAVESQDPNSYCPFIFEME